VETTPVAPKPRLADRCDRRDEQPAVSGVDPEGQAEAAQLGARYRGQPVDLDEGVPFDIYALFAEVTGRDYNHRSHDDELAILVYARAFEDSARG
jgi:hypothetical protein